MIWSYWGGGYKAAVPRMLSDPMDVHNEPEIREARTRWVKGGSMLPLVELLIKRGAKVEAATYIRHALTQPGCPDAEALRAILEQLPALPAGWDQSLAEFALSPSPEAWKALLRFVPPENFYLTVREAVGKLRGLGLSGGTIFRCLSESGLTPTLVELVEEGQVSSRELEERATHAAGAKATYLGLAAEAAFLAGDMLGTVRLLRESMANENEWCSVLPHSIFVRERASAELTDMLDRAGIPRAHA